MNNRVQGNFIGTDGTDTGLLNNSRGVQIDGAPDNTVGGTTTGARNVISGNDGPGVFVKGNAATGNRILSNSVHSNGQLGIDLAASFAPDGVTANDAGDGDTGPNNFQNFPVLSEAAKSGKKKTVVEGTLNSTANTTFTIQFFSSLETDSSGNGEGRRFLGQTSVTTDASGNVSFTATTPRVAAEQVVTATATNETTGDTSEFSRTVVAS